MRSIAIRQVACRPSSQRREVSIPGPQGSRASLPSSLVGPEMGQAARGGPFWIGTRAARRDSRRLTRSREETGPHSAFNPHRKVIAAASGRWAGRLPPPFGRSSWLKVAAAPAAIGAFSRSSIRSGAWSLRAR